MWFSREWGNDFQPQMNPDGHGFKSADQRRGAICPPPFARNRDAQGFRQNQEAAHDGGNVAGKARRDLEKKSGRNVVTSENYLGLTQKVKCVKQVKG